MFYPESTDVVNSLRVSGIIRGVELDRTSDDVPTFLLELIRRCCRRNPTQRPSSEKAATYLRRHVSSANIDQDRISRYLARLDGFVTYAELRGRAEAGDFHAMYQYGELCLAGTVAPTATANAASFFEQAALGGLAKAQFRYGLLLYKGLLGPADVKRGRTFLDMAAEQQNEQALKFLKENPEPRSATLESSNPYMKPAVIILARRLQAEVLELVKPEKYRDVLKNVSGALETAADRKFWFLYPWM
jgi:hypothetical protein